MKVILNFKTLSKRGKNMERLDILQSKLQHAQYAHRPIVVKIILITRNIQNIKEYKWVEVRPFQTLHHLIHTKYGFLRLLSLKTELMHKNFQCASKYFSKNDPNLNLNMHFLILAYVFVDANRYFLRFVIRHSLVVEFLDIVLVVDLAVGSGSPLIFFFFFGRGSSIYILDVHSISIFFFFISLRLYF